MFIQEVTIHEFRNLKYVHLGPFGAPPKKSDIVVLAGANGGGKSSVLEVLSYAFSNAFGMGYGNRRPMPNRFRFDVSIGLSSEELLLIQKYLDENNNYQYQRDALEQLVQKRGYVRTFRQNVTDAQQALPVYDRCHGMVQHILRQHLKRPMGFSLKADRFYPPEGFQWQDRLFAHEQMATREHVWSMGFAASENQYRDMYDYLVQLRYHYFQSLGEYHDALERGEATTKQKPVDPIAPYEALLGHLLPGYTFGRKKERVPSNLFVQLPNKEVITFHELSSGEKEVFFLLSFFIRHGVEHSVIVIDEPELHLHPELARRLVRLMLGVKPGNQIWLATHNGEIIDEAGRDKTYYIGRGEDKSEVVPGAEEPSAALQLRSLFGVSGYIGVARNMVFLEGEGASADRKAFGWLFGEKAGSVKLIPAGGVDNHLRINAAVLAILESTFGVCQFYLIRDRDYLTPEMADAYAARSRGRLHVLARNQIENYLLDAELIRRVLLEQYDRALTAGEVRDRLRSIARALSGEVLRDMTAFRLNIIFRPQDFSLGRFFEKTPVLDACHARISEKLAAFDKRVLETVDEVRRATDLAAAGAGALIDGFKDEVERALKDDCWHTVFPGKMLLAEFAQRLDLKSDVGFVNALIKEMAASEEFVDPELLLLRETVLAGREFTTRSVTGTAPAAVVPQRQDEGVEYGSGVDRA
jgi:energy-coupling factor transporter ATP-binding protein EcfA2